MKYMYIIYNILNEISSFGLVNEELINSAIQDFTLSQFTELST